MLSAMTRINITTVPQPCFKMRPDKEPSPSPEDHLDISLILERLGLADIDYDDVSEAEWCFPETPCTEMASRHLSGGGLVTKSDTPVRTITPASSSSTSSDDSHPTNPFRNTHMRLVLEADEVLEELAAEIGDFSSTNPFKSVSPKESTETVMTREFVEESRKSLAECAWYHGAVSWQDSIILLHGTEPGTFFVRDSADPNFLFSLSLQTIRGPTSVRLHHSNGHFRLDSGCKADGSIPSFRTVIELVEYYIAKSRRRRRKNRLEKCSKQPVWIDVHGQVYSNILLTKPLPRQGDVPPLKHLCRLQVNSALKSNLTKKRTNNSTYTTIQNVSKNSNILFLMDRLNVPPSVGNFLKEYPYSM